MTRTSTVAVRLLVKDRQSLEEEAVSKGYVSLTPLLREIIGNHIASKGADSGGASGPRAHGVMVPGGDGCPGSPSALKEDTVAAPAVSRVDPIDEFIADLFRDNRSEARVPAGKPSPPSPGPELDSRPRVERVSEG